MRPLYQLLGVSLPMLLDDGSNDTVDLRGLGLRRNASR